MRRRSSEEIVEAPSDESEVEAPEHAEEVPAEKPAKSVADAEEEVPYGVGGRFRSIGGGRRVRVTD